MKALKVVHISASTNGGAGRAAYRLHEAMLERPGVDSTFITAESPLNEHKVNQLAISKKKPGIFHRISNRFGFPILNSQKNYHRLKYLCGQYENYTMPTTDYQLEHLEIIKNADIINLHWISNFVNIPTFFRAYKNKPIVWTLHDMNPFMGGFHYKNDFINNPSYHLLERQLLKIKVRAISEVANLSIVTPSQWLMNYAMQSNAYKPETTFRVIPYSLNLKKFKPVGKKEAKSKLTLTNHNIPCILIVADYLNYRKGFDLLVEALKTISTTFFQVITIGNTKLDIQGNFHLLELGIINDDELLSAAYSAADLFVLPSREDNLPNVMLESFACGTPVLSFKTGGMQEWILPGFNGIFADSNDALGLKEALEKFLGSENQYQLERISEFASNNFAPDIQVKKYIDLYGSFY